MYCQNVLSGPVPIGAVRRAVGAVQALMRMAEQSTGHVRNKYSPRYLSRGTLGISSFVCTMIRVIGGAAHVPLLRGRMAYCVKWGLVIHGVHRRNSKQEEADDG